MMRRCIRTSNLGQNTTVALIIKRGLRLIRRFGAMRRLRGAVPQLAFVVGFRIFFIIMAIILAGVRHGVVPRLVRLQLSSVSAAASEHQPSVQMMRDE